MGIMDRFTVNVTAKQIRKRNVRLKFWSTVALICTTILLMFYAFVYLANSLGNFTVRIKDRQDDAGIVIAETRTFDNPTQYLVADPVGSMDNITESWLPDNIDEVDGSHNGKNHIAYTFYIKNNGAVDIDYLAEIKILDVKKNADEAIRVKVYKNGEPTLYAKPQKGTLMPEPDTTPFYSIDKVSSTVYEDFKVGDIDKYTVVVWLEGNDPECINDIIGGRVKLAMHFSIVEEVQESIDQ